MSASYMRIRQLALFLAVSFLLVSVFNVLRVQSQGEVGNGLNISPVRQDMIIERGQTEFYEMNVENASPNPLVARGIVNDFVPGDENGNPTILAGDAERTPYSLVDWVSGLDDIELDVDEETTLQVSVTVPEDAAPGAYFGVVRYEAAAADSADEDTVAISASVGTLLLVTVPGDVVELASLEEIGATDSDGQIASFFETAPENVVIRIRNDGNNFVAPFGTVNIKNMSGDVVYSYEINNTQPRGNILPESVRRFENGIEGVGVFGKYTIEANISYGGGGQIITAETSFWVIPWKAILIITGVLVLLVLGATKGVKAYNRMVVDRAKGEKVKK